MGTSRQGATIRHLMVVPAISGTLDDPAHGGDDAKDACDPMTATKDSDRLNYTRGSGTTNGRCWQPDQDLGYITKLPWDTEDPKNGQLGRRSKRREYESHI